MNDLLVQNNNIVEKEAYTFDDVFILPQYSEIESRSDVVTATKFTKSYVLQIPLVASPMDTVCDYAMAAALLDLGGVGIIHRFMSVEEQCKNIAMVRKHWIEYTSRLTKIITPPIAAAIGVTEDFEYRAESLLEHGASVLVIDVAHGHHKNVKNALYRLRKHQSYGIDIVAGNIATAEAALDLISWGADALRIGIGGGSACETRIRTGVGVPQLTTINDIFNKMYEEGIETVPLISDGGIRYPGDAAKALAAGADSIMIGSLFSGTDEAPGETFVSGQWPNNKSYKVYRGLASATTKLKYKGIAQHVEGASKMIESRGSVVNIVGDILNGITSSMSYVGAVNLVEFREKVKFIKVTTAGLNEAHPHILR